MRITENILPHLNYFWHVGRQMSFTKAAQALRISQSAVSIQVKTLESKLQTQLFLRESKNKVAFSSAGLKLYNHCRTIFQNVDEAVGEILEQEMAGTLVVATTTTFGILIVVPFIKVFEAKFPKLTVHLAVSDTINDFSKGDIDLAIRWSNPVDLRLAHQQIASEHLSIVASPNYFKSAKPIRTPKDLDNHPIIMLRSDQISWNSWLERLPKRQRPTLPNRRIISNVFAIMAAVKLGMGVAFVSMYPIKDLLKKKQLLRVLADYPCPPIPFYFCYPKTVYPQSKTTAFITMLRDYIKEEYGDKIFDFS